MRHPGGRPGVNPPVAKSEGHKSFRRAALRALSRSAQMPPLPSDIRPRQLLVDVPMAYQIEKR